MLERVPFNVPYVSSEASAFVYESLTSRSLSGDGRFTRAAKEQISDLLEGRPCLLTTSCTHALELVAMTLDIGPGDEVIVPSFTFSSTAAAFARTGASLVFCDVDEQTCCLSLTSVMDEISSKTKAVVYVSYAGRSSDLAALSNFCDERGLYLIEDNAHGFLGTLDGQPLGTFGVASTLSFHETKNIVCGEGGAAVFRDPSHLEKAEIIREKGTNRSAFFRGQVDKYTWHSVGSSYLPAEPLMAILLANLNDREYIQTRRQDIWSRYLRELGGAVEGIRVPPEGDDFKSAGSFHMFELRVEGDGGRNKLISHLNNLDISAVFHYIPLHDAPVVRKYPNWRAADCVNSKLVSSELVRLPMFPSLSQSQQDRVIEAVLNFKFR